jgi:hypothetical protein
VPERTSGGLDRVRTAELIGALSLATDLGIGVPLEHGLHSTLIAMRLGERLGVDHETASQTYIGVSTRAAATLFAMEHGLVVWGELPIPRPAGRP